MFVHLVEILIFFKSVLANVGRVSRLLQGLLENLVQIRIKTDVLLPRVQGEPKKLIE